MEMREATGTRCSRIPTDLSRLILDRMTTRLRRLRETVEGCLQACQPSRRGVGGGRDAPRLRGGAVARGGQGTSVELRRYNR